MADLTKTVVTTQVGEGSTRTDISTSKAGRKVTETAGKVTNSEVSARAVVTTESTPGVSTTESTETSPERITTETKQPVVNRTVSEAMETLQLVGEQKTKKTAREDVGAQVTFSFRISDFCR